MSTIQQVKLGGQGLPVSAEGPCCMGMSVLLGSNVHGAADEIFWVSK